MRFYEECIRVAKSVGATLGEEQRERFIATPAENWYYPLGIWIGNHLLPHNAYLQEALSVLGYVHKEAMICFLVDFSQRYWKLRYADML